MAMVTVMAMAMAATVRMWAMAMRLAGNVEGKRVGSMGNGDGNEGCRQQEWQGRQGDGDGDKNCRQVNCDGDKEGHGDGDKGDGQATVMATVMKRAMNMTQKSHARCDFSTFAHSSSARATLN